MESRSTQHRLRLVGATTPAGMTLWSERSDATASVAAENRRASRNLSLDPTDPRWALAVRTYSQLQGTTLTPERRERLMRTARLLGVQAYEANMIITIVQSHARSGRPLGDVAGTVALVPVTSGHGRLDWARWIAAVFAGLMGAIFMIWWTLGG